MLTMTPALVPTNDRIPIMYNTNSKTIITPNNTPYSSPDLPGDALFFHRTLFINPQI
jgi:hypothetical protein